MNRHSGSGAPSSSGTFGHGTSTIRFWKKLVTRALAAHDTPFHLLSTQPLGDALRELNSLGEFAGPRPPAARDAGITRSSPPVRHWLSCKTQPARPLLHWWKARGMDIEVVSEFELLAALDTGYPAPRILVNGPAKHRWLPRHSIPGLNVNLDSAGEARALVPLARRLHWRLGIRFLTDEEFDPSNPKFPTQFGVTPGEAPDMVKRMKRSGVPPEIAHFHLRTNVADPHAYRRAIDQLAAVCEASGFQPRCVDCGGGFPPPHTTDLAGERFDAHFSPGKMVDVLGMIRRRFPRLEEIWLENGRFVSARSGVFVTRILDVKERRGIRQLICDGGRTLHALVSTWERHELLPLRVRQGATVPTGVYGPTCMAFDQLGTRALPATLRAGDPLIWFDAGAYHLPWETRFSHGLATVLWHDGRGIRRVRKPESFGDWWSQWK